MNETQFILTLEKGHAIPPRKKTAREYVPCPPSKWRLLVERAEHGDSVLIPLMFLTNVQRYAQLAGVEVRHRREDDMRTDSWPFTARAVRVWFVKEVLPP